VAGEDPIGVLLDQRLGFVELFVGMGAARVRDLFAQAEARRRASSHRPELVRSARPAASPA
jgi:hypothetical protein